jgi:ubiquinone/menaquinone biosynthesis C-methylase UbiE
VQTLQLIFNTQDAIRSLYRILKPGGVLIVTVPGITHTNDQESGNSWYWNFTPLSLKSLIDDCFSPSALQIKTYGNVLAAICFLHGLGAGDVSTEELDVVAKGYEVIIGARAVK